MYNFNILAGYSQELLKKSNIVPLELARKRYPRVSIKQLEKAQNDSITFLIVRHPFERLISAYRDKLVFAFAHSLHDKLGNRIIRRYRKSVRQYYFRYIYLIQVKNQLFDTIIEHFSREKMVQIQNGQNFPNL